MAEITANGIGLGSILDDSSEAARVNRSANYSVFFDTPQIQAYDYDDAIREVMDERKKVRQTAGQSAGYDPLLTFDPDALAGVDPFTGTTARDNAEILYPLARPWLRLGYTSAGALNESVQHITEGVKKIADFAARNLGQFGDAPASLVPAFSAWAKKYQENADFWKGRAKATGEGAGEIEGLMIDFFGEVGGSFVPAMAEFLPTVKGPAVLYHGAKGAAEAEAQGRDPFLGFMRGAMERGLLGELLHTMSVLSRPLRATGTGILFEEQARLAPVPDGQEATPEQNLKAGATGFLFGLMGGRGKYGVRQIGEEIINLEKEYTAKAREMDIRGGAGVVGSEAGAVGKDIKNKAGEGDGPLENGSDRNVRSLVLSDMIDGLRQGEAGLRLDDSGTSINVTGRFTSNLPWLGDFMTEFQKATKKSVTKEEIVNTIKKDLSGKELTEKQRMILEKLEPVIRQTENEPFYLEAREGMKKKVAVGELEKGDRIVMDGEEFEHQGYDAEGNAILRDGEVVKADPFEILAVDAVKRESVSAPAFVSELPVEPFELTPQMFRDGKMTPEAQKLHDTVSASLTQSKKLNIKNIVRQETGQIKAGDVLEMKEIDLLNLQMRMASRAARQAFREGKAEGTEAGLDSGILKGLIHGAREGFREGRKEGTEAGLNTGIMRGLVVGAREGFSEGKRIAAEHYRLMAERARQRAEARQDLKGMIDDLKGVTKSLSTMDAFNAENIRGIIDGLDLTKLSTRKRLELEKARDFLARSPDTEMPDHVLDDLARLDRTPVRDLTVDEIRSLHTAVMHYAKQAEMKETLRVGREKRKFKEAKQGAIGEMKEVGDPEMEILTTKPSLWDKFSGAGDWIRKTLGIRQNMYDLIVEKVAGANSTIHRVLFRGVHEGRIVQIKYGQDARRMFREDLEKSGFTIKAGKDRDVWLDGWVTAGEVLMGQNIVPLELQRHQRIALYRHLMNEDNRAAVMEGGFGLKNAPPSKGYTPNTVIRMTDAGLDAFMKSLTPDEIRFAHAADRLFEEQFRRLDEAFRKINGYPLPKVENYMPKEVMPLQRGGLAFETEEGMEAFRQFTARVGIDKGMLIARTSSKKPIYVNDFRYDLTRSVERAGAYIGLEEPMRNASKLLYDIDFKRELVDRYGRETWEEIEKGLKDIAGSHRQVTDTERGLLKLKTTAVQSILSMNPWIWANQPFSLALYQTYVEPRYLIKAVWDASTKPKETLNRHRMYSPELVDRIEGGYDRDVATVFKQQSDKIFYGGGEPLKNQLMEPTKWFDLTAVVPGMQASVYKALAEFKAGKMSETVARALDLTDAQVAKMTPEEKIVQAYRFADWTTERTQAQSGMEFRSSLTRGSPAEQFVTAFGSQVNTMLNLVRRSYNEYRVTGSRESLQNTGKAIFQVFFLNAAFMMGIDRVRDYVYGRESKSVVQGFLDNAAGLLFFVRDVEKTMTAALDQGYRAPDAKIPIQKYLDVMKSIAVNIHTITVSQDQKKVQDAWANMIDDHLTLLALSTGYPYETPVRIGKAIAGENRPQKQKQKGVFDVIEDEIDEVFQ